MPRIILGFLVVVVLSLASCGPTAAPTITLDGQESDGAAAAVPKSNAAAASAAPTSTVDASTGAPPPKGPVPPPETPPNVPSAGATIDLAHAHDAVVQAQNQPTLDHAVPSGLADVAFASTEMGFGVTTTGGIYRTRDAGTSWEPVYYLDAARFAQVLALNPSVAIAIGSSACTLNCDGPAVFVLTDDGGSTWQAFEPRGPAGYTPSWPVLQYQFVSETVGFATIDPDQNGYTQHDIATGIIRTDDGGRTWRMLSLPGDLLAVDGASFISPDVGFATAVRRMRPGSGDIESVVLATRDGGTSWQDVYTMKTGRLESIDFFDAQNGFAAGGAFSLDGGPPGFEVVLTTHDGGRTWLEVWRVDGQGAQPVTRLRFIDAKFGWAATGSCSKMGANGPCGGQLSVTHDGGQTWTPTSKELVRFAAVGRGVWLVSSERVGPDTEAPLWRSQDGGATWDSFAPPAELPRFYDVQFLNQMLGHAAGPGGWFQTIDGGLHWIPSSIRPAGQLPTPISVTTGAAAIRYSQPLGRQTPRLEQTSDGGRTWTALSIPTVAKADVYHVSLTFLDDKQGWLATSTYCVGHYCRLVLHGTRDGGRSWQLLTMQFPRLDFGSEAPKLAFGDALHGAALFASGNHVLLTHDGGYNWTDVVLPADMHVSGLSYRGPNDIWVTAERDGHGLLVYSQDAGQTWDVTRFASVQPYAVSFGTQTDGWIAGRLGERIGALLVSHDAGRSWTELRPSVSS